MLNKAKMAKRGDNKAKMKMSMGFETITPIEIKTKAHIKKGT
jgi:hypothetical protein